MNRSLTEVHSKYNHLLCASVSTNCLLFSWGYPAMRMNAVKITLVSDCSKSTLEIRTASSKYVLLELS